MILQYTYSVDNIVYIPRLTDDNYILPNQKMEVSEPIIA